MLYDGELGISLQICQAFNDCPTRRPFIQFDASSEQGTLYLLKDACL